MSLPGSSRLPSNVPPRGMPPGPKAPPSTLLRILSAIAVVLVVVALVFLLK